MVAWPLTSSELSELKESPITESKKRHYRRGVKRGVKLDKLKVQQLLQGKNLAMVSERSGINIATAWNLANGNQDRVMPYTLKKLNAYLGQNVESGWDYVEKATKKSELSLKNILVQMLQSKEVSVEAFEKLYKLL